VQQLTIVKDWCSTACYRSSQQLLRSSQTPWHLHE